MPLSRWGYAVTLTLVAGFGLTGRTAAEILYATETTVVGGTTAYSSNLVSFNTINPGTLLTTVQVNGADLGTPASGNPNGADFVLSGIDFQPSTNQLYGMGDRSGFEQRAYTINPITGAATALTNGPFVGATSAGFNFDPVRNVIRIAADQQGNAHVAPATGSTTTDTNLAYAAGDSNAGQTPIIGGAAYTNHVASAASTTLYGIDLRGTGTLVTIGTSATGSADGGQLHTVGAMNLSFAVPAQSHAAFFISPNTGIAYAAVEDGRYTSGPLSGQDQPAELFSVNLSTGAATDLGSIGDAPNSESLSTTVWGLSAPVAVPEPGSLALVGLAFAGAGYIRRRTKPQ